MWAATLAGAQRRTRRARRRNSGTRALEDRLAALGHNLARRRTGGTRGRGVHRTRASLRNNQPARWRSCGSAGGGLHGLSGTNRRTQSTGRSRCGRRWTNRRSGRRCGLGFNGRFGDCDLRCGDRCFGFIKNRDLILDQRLGSPGRLNHRRGNVGCWRRGWLWARDDRRGWTRHRLRRDETRRRLGLGRRSRLRAGSNRRSRRRRPWWNRRRRSGGGPRDAGRCETCRRDRTCSGCGLRGALRDRLQYIAGLGDVRQVDLGLELILRRRSRARAAGSAGLVLGKVFLYALGFVFFDRTGVRFLFGYADLNKNVEDRLALDLKFSCQIVDSNLVLHSAPFPPLCPVWLRLHSILTVQVDVGGLKPAMCRRSPGSASFPNPPRGSRPGLNPFRRCAASSS